MSNELPSELPPVARNINVFCKKCDSDRYFKVITHLSATSAKIKCEVCGCHQTLKLEAEKKPATARKATTKTPKAARANSSAQWAIMKESYKGPDASGYTMAQQYVANQSLNHPTFGIGFVTKVFPNKVEVLFSEGAKELLHCRK